MSTSVPAKRLAPLVAISPFLRIADRSVYQAYRRGRAPWLTHSGPDGTSSHKFFVDPDLLALSEQARGHELHEKLVAALDKWAQPVVSKNTGAADA